MVMLMLLLSSVLLDAAPAIHVSSPPRNNELTAASPRRVSVYKYLNCSFFMVQFKLYFLCTASGRPFENGTLETPIGFLRTRQHQGCQLVTFTRKRPFWRK